MTAAPIVESVLELRDLSKRFGDVQALDGASFEVPPGRMVGFLGPNGAGKTTAMRSIFGLVRLDRGEVLWDGKPLGPHVYVLQGPHDGAKGMHWAALTYGEAGQDGMHDLTRVKSDDAFNALVGKHAHPGMIFIVTDLPLHPNSRSGRDFVIMS